MSYPVTAPNRRWFRYSLRTLFVVVTVFGCWLGYELNWIRQRHELLAKHEALVSKHLGQHWDNLSPRQRRLKPAVPLPLLLFGEEGKFRVVLAIEAERNVQEPIYSFPEWKRAERLFPESEIEGFFVVQNENPPTH